MTNSMYFILSLLVLAISYVLGSIPFGLLFVKLLSGKDLRQVESTVEEILNADVLVGGMTAVVPVADAGIDHGDAQRPGEGIGGAATAAQWTDARWFTVNFLTGAGGQPDQWVI